MLLNILFVYLFRNRFRIIYGRVNVSTIKDVAKAANVSPATVSKALNNRSDVSEKTKKKILEIAKALNFTPRAFARGLKNKRTENIGVILCRESNPLSGNPFYSRVIEGIEAELSINNYNLVLHIMVDYLKKEELPKMLKERNVDGILLVGMLNKEFIEEVHKINIPAVIVDPNLIVKNFDQVLIDNEHGAFLATQYLLNNGHRRIGFISGDITRSSFYQRFVGYKKALDYNNIPLDESLINTGGLEEGYQQTKDLLELQNPPTAIFSSNDTNAIIGYKAARDLGYKIPDDISFIGFDDIDLTKFVTPTLSTIRVYKTELGSIAVRNLLKIINKEKDVTHTNVLPIKLIERDSVTDITSLSKK